MTGIVRRIVLFTAATLPLAAAAAQDLPTDPSLITGELRNGLRYVLKKHENPPGRVAMWLHIHSGSLNETDAQRGLAHYLEHMAFNGSENFEAGTIVPFFQSLGMTFGRDQNAFTSMEQTTYQLALPNAKPGTMRQGAMFFADVLFRLKLAPTEIEAERQIILEERRRGLSGRQRVADYVLQRLAPGSIYSQRNTIGLEETIQALQEKDFRDYYEKWYRASNATLLMVGDFDADQAIEVIKEKFGPAPRKPRPIPQDPQVRAYDKSFAVVASDDEIRTESLQIVRLEPARPPVTTVPQFRSDLVMRLGEVSMNRRLDAKVAAGGTSYVNARVAAGNDANAVYTAELSVRPSPGQWRAALHEISLELQRARAFGFSARELDDARKQMLANAERAAETEPTQPAQALLGRINRAVTEGTPILSAQQRLDLLRQMLPTIGEEEVAKRFADEFAPTAVAFIAILPAGSGVPTEAELLDLGTRALDVTPTREADIVRPSQLMSELPTPGQWKDLAQHEASGVWSGWLDNGVRVHFRAMDQRKNEVSVSIDLIGGELLETAETRGLTSAAQFAWSRPATQTLSSTDVRELLTGKKVSVGGGPGGGRGGRRGAGAGGNADALSLTVSGSPDDLETGMQLAHLLLTQPKVESATFTQARTVTRELIEESLKNPMMLGMRTAMAAPYPDDVPRTQPLAVEQVDRMTLEATQAWMDKLVRNSPIEVTIVGDIARERALELAARYLGSLPARERVGPETFASLRKLARPGGPRTIERTLVTPTAQAFVMYAFYGADEANVADARALAMAARILSTRMVKEVREDEQLVYSIGAASRAATTYPGFGLFSASAPTDPGKVDALVRKLESMYDAFAANGPTAEELDVARKQMATTLDEQMREPAYWSRQLGRMTFRGVSLDDVLGEPAAYQAISADEIRSAFARCAAPERRFVVVVRPSAAEEDAASVR